MPQPPAAARPASVRAHNLAVVLGVVAERGPVSRAGIAERTGLTRPAVSNIVEALVNGRLVEEAGPGRAARPAGGGGPGRPGQPLVLSSAGPMGLGLELNVDYLSCVVVDLAGTVRAERLLAVDLRSGGPGRALDLAVPVLRECLASAGVDQLAGAVLAVPGLVRAGGEEVLLAPNLGWRDAALLPPLRVRLADLGRPGVRVQLFNEADLAALAVLRIAPPTRPDGKPVDSFVHVSGEIGVGAGVLVAGSLFRGTHGFTGEIGHVPVDLDGQRGPVCRCGRRGCLELVAGQEALLRAGGVRGAPGSQAGGAGQPVEELIRRAERGDPAVLAALAAAAHGLGSVLGAVLNLLDVSDVVLGGLYARLAPWLVGPVQEELGRRVLAAGWVPVRVHVSALGSRAAVLGAATTAVREVLTDPAGWLAGR